jgi:hypothetical protein
LAGKGDTPRKVDKAVYDANYERIFGAYKRSGSGVIYREALPDGATSRKHDNGVMRSQAMGCVDPAEQKRRLEIFAAHGVDNARYDQHTGELVYSGGSTGYQLQKKLAKLHGLDVG